MGISKLSSFSPHWAAGQEPQLPGLSRGAQEDPLDSFKGDIGIGIGIDIDVDMDIDSDRAVSVNWEFMIDLRP